MGQLATVDQKLANVGNLLKANLKSLDRVAGAIMTPERMAQIALNACRNESKLLDCDMASLVRAVMGAAQLGLAVDGIAGHAFLVPFKGQIQLIIGYKGLMALAMRHPAVLGIQVPQTIYEGEPFTYERGLRTKLEYTPLPPDRRGEQPIAHFQVAWLKDAPEPVVQWMWDADVIAVRNNVYRWEDKPWKTDYLAMAQKTVAIRLCKWLPFSAELQRAVIWNEAADTGREQTIDVELVDMPQQTSQRPRTLGEVLPKALPRAPRAAPANAREEPGTPTPPKSATTPKQAGSEEVSPPSSAANAAAPAADTTGGCPDSKRGEVEQRIRQHYAKLPAVDKKKFLKNVGLVVIDGLEALNDEELRQVEESIR